MQQWEEHFTPRMKTLLNTFYDMSQSSYFEVTMLFSLQSNEIFSFPKYDKMRIKGKRERERE
jgi:hypothetical protein